MLAFAPVITLTLLPTVPPVPMFFLFPLFPVSFHIFMGYPAESRGQVMTIILRQRSQAAGDFSGLNVTPLTVIVVGSVPVPFIRPPPVVLIIQNIHFIVGDHVNISSRYYNQVRRRGKPDGREAVPYRDVYTFITYCDVYTFIANIYIYPGITLGCTPC